VVELKQLADAAEARLAKLRKEKQDSLEQVRRTALARPVAAEIQELLHRLRGQEEQLAAVKAQLARAERQLADLPAPADKGVVQAGGRGPAAYAPEASNQEMIDSLYRELVRRYELIQLELAAPPRVVPIQSASAPTQKDTKKQLMGTVFAGLLGFGLMAVGAVGFETLTRRVSGLPDVKAAAVGCPVVGVVPCRPDPTPRDRAAANEAIDKLRAYVSQAWLSRGATTVAVTSPLGDEGKAFAAFGLAASLAQSGYKTLVADFDLRAPQLHALAGVPNGVGVCEVLRAEADARAAVQVLPTGLHLLTAGAWSDDARRAATGERLEALLAKLKGPYDCVVLHGHALLTAAEAVEVARRCEVVLVCARYRETTTPLLKKAAERVAALEIPYAGVVYVGATETEALC
jgi:Mrp family chromosome partitioning ATPase